MIKIFYFNKRGIQKKDIQKCLGFLSEEEIEKYKKYKKEDDAENFAFARFFSKNILSGIFNIEAEKIVFEIQPHGKPKLKFPEIKNFDFNISHSGEMIVVAINDQGDVGVDIEKIQEIDFSLINEFCTKNEEIYINKNIEEKLKRFYEIWTLKEAYLKALGKGLYLPMKDFSFCDKDKLISNIVLNKNFKFKIFNFDSDYMLSLCTNGKELPNKICEIKKI